MKFGKRQLILATLVLALGAAVYLNWQFSGNNELVATDAVAESEKEYGAAQLVSTPNVEDNTQASTDPNRGLEVDVSIDDTADPSATDDDTPANTSPEISATLAEARLSRQQARDSAKEFLTSLLESETDATALQDAADKAVAIADNIIQENNIETLIKAKGYSDCMVYIENGECNVLIQIEMAQPNDAVIIQDIVNTQSGISYDKIKIIEVE